MIKIGRIRPFQLRIRNPESPQDFGINFMMDPAKRALSPRVQMDLSAALIITVKSSLQSFIADSQEKALSSHFGMPHGADTRSLAFLSAF